MINELGGKLGDTTCLQACTRHEPKQNERVSDAADRIPSSRARVICHSPRAPPTAQHGTVDGRWPPGKLLFATMP